MTEKKISRKMRRRTKKNVDIQRGKVYNSTACHKEKRYTPKPRSILISNK